MDKKSKSSSCKRDRKTIEKDRRNHMKYLYSQLNSLIPQDGSSPKAIPDQIDDATNYIKQLRINVEKLRRTRDELLGVGRSTAHNGYDYGYGYSRVWSNSPVKIDINVNGPNLEVNLVTGLECQFVFTEVVRILHEESTQVVNASYSVADNIVFHTIHAQMGEANDDVSRIAKRLKKFEL